MKWKVVAKMGNRLIKVFSKAQPEHYVGKMKFSSQELKKEFIEKVRILQETGISQEISSVDSIDTKQIIDGEELPHHKYNKIKNTIISLPIDIIEISVLSKYGEHTWKFNRTKLIGKVILENKESNVLSFKQIFDENEMVRIEYKVNPELANSVYELNTLYAASIELMNKIFTEIPEELHSLVEKLKYELEYWERVYEVEKLFEIQFDLSQYTNEKFNEIKYDVEELYFLLVEKVVLRKNYGIETFLLELLPDNNDFISEYQGKKIALTFVSEIEKKILGKEISLYIVCAAFNNIVKDILEGDGNNKVVISLTESDSEPRYVSFKGFLSEKEQAEEHKRLVSNQSKNIKPYEEALSLNELHKRYYD